MPRAINTGLTGNEFIQKFDIPVFRNLIRNARHTVFAEIAEKVFLPVLEDYKRLEAETTANAEKAFITHLFYFLKFSFSYKPDNQAYTEQIKSPVKFWHDKRGDCEDYAIFICSLLSYLGIDCALKLVSQNTEQYTHIYALAIMGGTEYPLDPAFFAAPGVEETNITAEEIINV